MGQSQALVVDADLDVLDTVTETLREKGYLAQPAISGDVARVLFEQRVSFRLPIMEFALSGLALRSRGVREKFAWYSGECCTVRSGQP